MENGNRQKPPKREISGLVIIKRPMDDLKIDPKNARTHGQKNLEAIKTSLERYGQVEPLVINKRTGVIVGGHGRIMAMRALGWTHADTVEVDLSETEASALALLLNRTAELAEWDDMLLSDALASLQSAGIEADVVGFDVPDPLAELEAAVEEKTEDLSCIRKIHVLVTMTVDQALDLLPRIEEMAQKAGARVQNAGN